MCASDSVGPPSGMRSPVIPAPVIFRYRYELATSFGWMRERLGISTLGRFTMFP